MLFISTLEARIAQRLALWSCNYVFKELPVGNYQYSLARVLKQNFSLQNVPVHPTVMGTWRAKLIGAVIGNTNNHILPQEVDVSENAS